MCRCRSKRTPCPKTDASPVHAPRGLDVVLRSGNSHRPGSELWLHEPGRFRLSSGISLQRTMSCLPSIGTRNGNVRACFIAVSRSSSWSMLVCPQRIRASISAATTTKPLSSHGSASSAGYRTSDPSLSWLNIDTTQGGILRVHAASDQSPPAFFAGDISLPVPKLLLGSARDFAAPGSGPIKPAMGKPMTWEKFFISCPSISVLVATTRWFTDSAGPPVNFTISYLPTTYLGYCDQVGLVVVKRRP